MDKKLKRSQAEKIRRRLTKALQPHGFERTKPSFWTRPADTCVQFIHLHLFTFQPAFRVHLGIRVLNDPFEATALNGPNSDEDRSYNLHFHNTDDTAERCNEELLRYCVEVGMPWFRKWSSLKELISNSESPLRDGARAALKAALNGKSQEEDIKQTRALLGLG